MAAGKTLARQQTLDASTGQAWSLVRDNQFRSLLETMFLDLYGPGVVTGCRIAKASGFTVTVPSGSVFFAHGVTLTLAANQSYSGAAVANSTVYLWARILRTQATQTDPAASDTYTLDVTHNTTGTRPGDDYFPLAVLTNGGSQVDSIDNAPNGKFLRALPNLGRLKKTLSGAATLTTAEARNRVLVFGGQGSTVTLPNEAGRVWYVQNDAGSEVQLRTAAQTKPNIKVAAGYRALVTCDGEDVLDFNPTSADAVTLAKLRLDFDDLESRFRKHLQWLSIVLGFDYIHPDLMPEIDLV